MLQMKKLFCVIGKWFIYVEGLHTQKNHKKVISGEIKFVYTFDLVLLFIFGENRPSAWLQVKSILFI